MKSVFNVIKMYYSLDSNNEESKLYLCIEAFILFISILVCFIENWEFGYSTSLHKSVDFNTISFELAMLIIMCTNTSLGFLQIWNKKDYNSKNKNLLMQFPIIKKNIYTARYIVFLLSSIPVLISILYLIFLNITKGNAAYISSFAGFIAAGYSLWLALTCLYIGYSDFSIKKIAKIFAAIYIFCIIFIPIALKFHNSYFISLLSPVLKVLSHVGGIYGIIMLILAEALGYFLCMKLPIILSNKTINN